MTFFSLGCIRVTGGDDVDVRPRPLLVRAEANDVKPKKHTSKTKKLGKDIIVCDSYLTTALLFCFLWQWSSRPLKKQMLLVVAVVDRRIFLGADKGRWSPSVSVGWMEMAF